MDKRESIIAVVIGAVIVIALVAWVHSLSQRVDALSTRVGELSTQTAGDTTAATSQTLKAKSSDGGRKKKKSGKKRSATQGTTATLTQAPAPELQKVSKKQMKKLKEHGMPQPLSVAP